MELCFEQLKHFGLHALDGDIGGCEDLLLDDEQWIVRYIVADTNTWLPMSRRVVISPVSIQLTTPDEHKLELSLTREAVKNSPTLDSHQPISREYESLFFKYFGYGYYWTGPGSWGEYAHPLELVNQNIDEAQTPSERQNHLRSCEELTGYKVQLKDGKYGVISDFMVQLPGWSVTHLVISESEGWLTSEKTFLVTTESVANIDWAEHTISLSVRKNELERLEPS